MLESLTIWNYLQIISFIFGLIAFFVLPFTVLNLYFNLYPRYKDWRASKSIEALDKRLAEIDVGISLFEKYREDSKLLFLYLLAIAIKPLTYLLISFALFFLSVSIFFASLSINSLGIWSISIILAVILLNAAIILIFPSILLLGRTLNAIRYFDHPNVLLEEREELLIEARRKGVVSEKELEKVKLTEQDKEK